MIKIKHKYDDNTEKLISYLEEIIINIGEGFNSEMNQLAPESLRLSDEELCRAKKQYLQAIEPYQKVLFHIKNTIMPICTIIER